MITEYVLVLFLVTSTPQGQLIESEPVQSEDSVMVFNSAQTCRAFLVSQARGMVAQLRTMISKNQALTTACIEIKTEVI